MKKRILSLLLCLCMAATLLPVTVYAGGTNGIPDIDSLSLWTTDRTEQNGLGSDFRVSGPYNTSLPAGESFPTEFEFPYPTGCTKACLQIRIDSQGCNAVSVTVTQGGTGLQNENTGGSSSLTFISNKVDLAQEITITIARADGVNLGQDGESDQTAVPPKVYKIKPQTKNFDAVKLNDGFNIPNYTFAPGFVSTTADYSVKVPTGTSTLTVSADAPDGMTLLVDHQEGNPSVSLTYEGGYARDTFQVEVSKSVEGNAYTTVSRQYTFRVAYGDENGAPLTAELFQFKNDAVYNGQQQENLVTSSVLPNAAYKYKRV